MKDRKKLLVTGFTVVAVLGAAIGVYCAIHSQLFMVQVVEVADQPDNAPVDAVAITELAAVPTGKANLFDLDLKVVEKRVLSNHWIQEVRLQKRFPQTLSVGVVFRDPIAIFQQNDGSLAYLDADAKPFGQLNLMLRTDLPILSGFGVEPEGSDRVRGALRILEHWEKSGLRSVAELSTLSWNPRHGFRALISYRLGKGTEPAPRDNRPLGRTTIDLGQEIDAEVGSQLGRLAEVVRYLSVRSIAARQIFADVGKKIVVKTSRGS